MPERLRIALALVQILAGAAAALTVSAQTYPTKPIRMLIPYPPGGGVDAIMRPFAQELAARLGQQIIIDNRGGSGGSIAMEAVARSAPDGHTIVAAITAQLAINPALYRSLPYDPVRDFAPITLFADGTYILVVHPSLPVRSVKELLRLARQRPGEIHYGSAGNGSGGHMAGALLTSMTGAKLVHVPYKGGGPAQVGLLSGEIQADFQVWAYAQGHIESGRIRAIAVTKGKRPAALPNIPTIAESGVPGYDSGVWYALAAPAGTPRAAIDRLNAETLAVLRNPAYVKRLADQAIDPIGSTPEELGRYVRSELDKWAKVVRDTGARID